MIGTVKNLKPWKSVLNKASGFFFDARGKHYMCFDDPKEPTSIDEGADISFDEAGPNMDNSATIARNIKLQKAGPGESPRQAPEQRATTEQRITRLAVMKVAGSLVAAKIQAGVGLEKDPIEQVKRMTLELEKFVEVF